VQVFGELSNVEDGRTVSTYILDNSTPAVFNGTSVPNDGLVPVFSFYQSPSLVNGNHSLLITSIQNQLVLSTIVHGSNDLGSSTIPLPSSTTGATTLPISSSPSTSSKSRIPVGGIVGGMIAVSMLLVVGALIFFCPLRRRKISSLETQDSHTDYPPDPEPFLLGSRWEMRNTETISVSGDSREGSIVSVQFPSGLNADSGPSSNSVFWGSIPYSIPTTSTVEDRPEMSFVDEKDGRVLGDSSPAPITTTLNYRTTAVSTGSRSTWNTRESAPPPSWSGLSDAPPSYTTTKSI